MKLFLTIEESIFNDLVVNGEVRYHEHPVGYFQDAYNWLKSVLGYNNNPIWAWYLYDGKRDAVDGRIMSDYRYGEYEARHYLLEVEVPDKEVTLLDFGRWYFVLGKAYLTPARLEDYKIRASEEEIFESWQRVFELENRDFIQATFPVLKSKYVKKIHWLED